MAAQTGSAPAPQKGMGARQYFKFGFIGVLVVLALVFIFENTQKVKVQFLWWHFTAQMWILLLILLGGADCWRACSWAGAASGAGAGSIAERGTAEDVGAGGDGEGAARECRPLAVSSAAAPDGGPARGAPADRSGDRRRACAAVPVSRRAARGTRSGARRPESGPASAVRRAARRRRRRRASRSAGRRPQQARGGRHRRALPAVPSARRSALRPAAPAPPPSRP